MEGTKNDAEKNRVDLLPFDALLAIAEVYTFGVKKYSERNWEAGMKWSRLFGAMCRHTWSWFTGEDKDKETGLSHLVHAGFCILGLIAYELRQVGEDDRPKR